MLEEGRLAGACGMPGLCHGGDAGFNIVSPTTDESSLLVTAPGSPWLC